MYKNFVSLKLTISVVTFSSQDHFAVVEKSFVADKSSNIGKKNVVFE